MRFASRKSVIVGIATAAAGAGTVFVLAGLTPGAFGSGRPDDSKLPPAIESALAQGDKVARDPATGSVCVQVGSKDSPSVACTRPDPDGKPMIVVSGSSVVVVDLTGKAASVRFSGAGGFTQLERGADVATGARTLVLPDGASKIEVLDSAGNPLAVHDLAAAAAEKEAARQAG
jgi:hypothetical protein